MEINQVALKEGLESEESDARQSAHGMLPYRPRRMDPNPFPPPARGRRGRGGNNLFANNNRDRLGANRRNHPDLEEEEEHREEVLPRPYRAEPRIDPI
ncbi:unnamed protein product [Prunus brigantina]